MVSSLTFKPLNHFEIFVVSDLRQVSSFILLHMTIQFSPEKAMASHSSTLAWKIPWTEEPRRLRSMGLLRVGHD